MLQELQAWWQNTSPETQGLLLQGGLALVAILGGYLLGSVVAGALRARNFDAVLRLPSASGGRLTERHGFTPTWFAGVLVRLTVWTGIAYWLAIRHGKPELAATLALAIQRAWALTVIAMVTLGLASLLAHRILECLHGIKIGPDAGGHRSAVETPSIHLAGGVAAGVYGLVVLLALLLVADWLDWPLMRSSTLVLWQLAQHLLTAAGALLIGCLGARWARDLMNDGAVSAEKRAGQYTALALVSATTLFAVAVPLTSTSLIFGLAVGALVGGLLWLLKDHLPDVAAGVKLHAQKVREVWLDGASWQVEQVGLLSTDVSRGGEFGRLHNRQALDASARGAPVVAARR